MNLLTANYSSCGWRIPRRPSKRQREGKKGELLSVLPNEVLYIAHSFGLSAFRLQCLGCGDFVRLLSVTFNINPHFVQPVDSTRLAEAPETFIWKHDFNGFHQWRLCVCASKDVPSTLFCFCRRSFRRYQSSAFPLTWKGTIPRFIWAAQLTFTWSTRPLHIPRGAISYYLMTSTPAHRLKN